MTEGRLLPRCGAFGPLKNLLPLAPSVHCLGRRYETPNAPIDRPQQQQIFRQIPRPAPIAHIALSAVRLCFSHSPVRFYPISRYRGISSDRNGERAGNGLSRRGEEEGFDGMAAQRRRHCELRRMLCPTPSLDLSLRGFLLLRKSFFEPSSPNANAEGKFRSAVYKTRGSPPPSPPSLDGEELFSLWRNAAEGSIEK